MLKKLALAAALTFPLAGSVGCGQPGYKITNKQLQPGGAFVAHVLKETCSAGCDQLDRGDLIQKIDGKDVKTAADIRKAKVTDGADHELTVWKKKLPEGASNPVTVKLNATPNETMAPKVPKAPPFWVADSAKLKETPDWARLRLFGHAFPQTLIVNSDGGLVNGRDLYGQKRVIVLFDWQTRTGQAHASTFLKTLQLAQDDLKAKDIEVIFAQLKFPGRDRAPMNDTDLRDFHKQHQVTEKEGGPKPFLPLYRSPNATEDQPARRQGLEGSTTLDEYLGTDPAILVVDGDGIIMWHSEGVVMDPEGKRDEDNYTIFKAITFAQDML